MTLACHNGARTANGDGSHVATDQRFGDTTPRRALEPLDRQPDHERGVGLHDLEEVWIGFGMPPLPGACELPPQPEWIQVVLAAMIPVEAGLGNVELGGAFPRARGSEPNEIVVCWRSF